MRSQLFIFLLMKSENGRFGNNSPSGISTTMWAFYTSNTCCSSVRVCDDVLAPHLDDFTPFFTVLQMKRTSTNVNNPDAHVSILSVSDSLFILFASYSRSYTSTAFRRHFKGIWYIFYDSELSFCITRTFGTK